MCGWDQEGTPHHEPTRDADRFLAFGRAVAHGEPADDNYTVSPRPLPLAANAIASNASLTVNSYLLWFSGTMGARWNAFPTATVFRSHGTQPGALNGGLTAVHPAFPAWDGAA